MKKNLLFLPFLLSVAFGVNVVQKPNYFEFHNLLKAGNDFSITQDEFFKCQPKINGTYEFILHENQTQINFYPKTPLVQGAKYSCSLTNGTKFDFTTAPFAIEEFRKIKNGLVVAKFNDFAEIADLKANLSVYKAENLAKNDISYEIKTGDNKTFFIEYNAKMDKIALEISNKMKSKFGSKITSGKIIKADEELFFDSKTAVNLTEVWAFGESFEDGKLGIRLYLKEGVQASSKFIRVKGVSNFSVSEPMYCGYYRYDENLKDKAPSEANYFIDIKSDEFM
ncbi:MAG: hypothetical protein J6W17_06565, partial [Campylobacter sp.]|nr:hypothetical protein [Campylobacter sp.]